MPLIHRPKAVRDGRVTEKQVRRQIRREYDRRNAVRARKIFAVLACVAIGLGVLAEKTVWMLVTMRGDGMSGTLMGGDVVLCDRENSPLADDSYEAGDLVLIRYSERASHYRVIRRVIGRAGDEVLVTARGRVILNGEMLDEPYATYREIDPTAEGGGAIANPFAPTTTARQVTDEYWDETIFPITVPEGSLFVLADNRDTFSDSRARVFGMVKERDVIGKASAVLWPAWRITALRALPNVGEMLRNSAAYRWVASLLPGSP